jgi:hypothetical protein
MVMKKKRPRLPVAPSCLVFARQEDGFVGEIEGDFLKREVGVVEPLFEHDMPVAVVASERRGLVGIDGQFPELKFLDGHSLVVALREGDLVEQPISATSIGHMLRPVRVKNVPHESMPPPRLAARELPQVVLRQCRRRHDFPLLCWFWVHLLMNAGILEFSPH